MKTLKAGDIRQEGDETKTKEGYNKMNGYEEYANKSWQPVRLLGHAILPSDLMVAEFRRP